LLTGSIARKPVEKVPAFLARRLLNALKRDPSELAAVLRDLNSPSDTAALTAILLKLPHNFDGFGQRRGVVGERQALRIINQVIGMYEEAIQRHGA
jgi:hypothetical protein